MVGVKNQLPKDADFAEDLDSSCQWLKANAQGRNEADEDYLQFLGELSDYVKTFFEEHGRDDDGGADMQFFNKFSEEACSNAGRNNYDHLTENQENNNDPDYALVLNSLVPYENAYALEVKKDDGTITYLRFEEEEDSTDERPRKVPKRSRSSSLIKESKASEISGSVYATRNSNFTDTNGPRSSPRLCSSDRSLQVVGGADEYGIFLKHLKLQGDTIVLEYKGTTIKYFESVEESLFDAGPKVEPATPDLQLEPASTYLQLVPASTDLQVEPASTDLQVEPASVTPIAVVRQPTLAVDRRCSSDHEVPPTVNPALVCGVSPPKIGHTSNRNSHYGKRLRSKAAVLQGLLPLRASATSNFRAMLFDDLKRPFSQGELDELQKHANRKKHVERHRESRGGGRTQIIKQLGKSYLEHNPGLLEEMKAVEGDPCKTLNLLRGLFFWLQNSPMKGSFRPWKDAECKTVMPESI